MPSSTIFVLTLLICGFLTWHGIFIRSLAHQLANKQIDHTYLGLPTYGYFNNLQYNLPYHVCKIDVWNNYIKFCTFSLNPFCSHYDVPAELVWIDPYHYFLPLKIESC